MGRQLTIEAVMAVFQSAMDAGNLPAVRDDGRAYRRSIHWDVSGGCQSPVGVTMYSRYHVSTERGLPLEVTLQTQCRKCRWCLMRRRHHWATHAVNEVHEASRTWFITLTCEPTVHHRLLSAARAAFVGSIEPDYDSLPHDKRFRALLGKFAPSTPSYGRELTLFLKRIRKNSRAQFRYLLVAEAHKSGLPHFHMLLHERGAPVRKAVIKAAWPNGFSKVQLCDGDRGALYLCKYLAKDASTRVRASFKYGRCPTIIDATELHSVSVTPSDPLLPASSSDGFPSLLGGTEDEDLPRGVWGADLPTGPDDSPDPFEWQADNWTDEFGE